MYMIMIEINNRSTIGRFHFLSSIVRTIPIDSSGLFRNMKPLYARLQSECLYFELLLSVETIVISKKASTFARIINQVKLRKVLIDRRTDIRQHICSRIYKKAFGIFTTASYQQMIISGK
jgi:hypothetical protein